MKLLPNKDNEASFGIKLYTYLADLNATEAQKTMQHRLDTLAQQWQNWRKARDNLSEDASDQQREKLAQDKPDPIVSALYLC